MNSELKIKLTRLYAYFSVPALCLHEICHLVTGFFVGCFYSIEKSCFIKNLNGTVCFLLEPKNHNKIFFKTIVVSLAPLYFVITIAILALFYNWCIYLLAYLLFTYKYSLPSRGDWDKVMYHKLFKKHLNNDRAMVLFFTLKGYYKKEKEEEERIWALFEED